MVSGNTRMDGKEPRRSEELSRLLASVPTPDVLSWDRVERIVAAAPPASQSWLDRVLTAGPALRYSAATFVTLLMGTGLLAITPAQSSRVGTVISAPLPAGWEVGGEELKELRHAAHADFATLNGSAELHFLTMQREGRPQLALALENVDEQVARNYYASLADRYPAIEAFPVDYSPVEGEKVSMLESAFSRLVRPEALSGLSDNEARIRVLGALSELGLTPESVVSHRKADGTLVIEINASLQIEVQGHSQEDLQSVGLGREFLGDGVYEQLSQ